MSALIAWWKTRFSKVVDFFRGPQKNDGLRKRSGVSRAQKSKPIVKIKKPSRRIVKKALKPVPPKKTTSRKVGPVTQLPKIAAKEVKESISTHFERAPSNPILKPYELNHWESQATFNPAALYEDGKVHLIYRAVGKGDVSVLGYASSYDGVHIDERLADPAHFSQRNSESKRMGTRIDYGSGGGWNGGCEDPRMTCIDDIVYLLYTAFDGWGSIRIALSTISLDDFLKKRWNWEDPVLISPPGEIHKNWVIFPEKINGKFAILHSVSPKVRVDYIKSLNELRQDDTFIQSHYVKSSRRKAWDSWVRGAGPPPIKTKYGWLLLYHAMDDNDPNRYKLGAMLLDLKDPTQVLYRSNAPILEPDACYENEGFKSGVVYSCGAVVVDKNLYLYYGGADTVSCVAVANLEKFLKDLMSSGAPKIKGVAKPKRKPYAISKAVKKKSHSLAKS